VRKAAVVLFRGQGRANRAHDKYQPDDHADDEQELPQAAELDVFVALVTEHEAVAAEVTHDREVRAGQRAENDQDNGDEQAPHQLALVLGLATDQGPNEQARGQETRGDKEHRQL